jgi:hypothetical protein
LRFLTIDASQLAQMEHKNNVTSNAPLPPVSTMPTPKDMDSTAMAKAKDSSVPDQSKKLDELFSDKTNNSFEHFIAERVLEMYPPPPGSTLRQDNNHRKVGGNCAIAIATTYNEKEYQKWDGTVDDNLPSGEAMVFNLAKANPDLTIVARDPLNSHTINIGIVFSGWDYLQRLAQYGGSPRWEEQRNAGPPVKGYVFTTIPKDMPGTGIAFRITDEEYNGVISQLKTLFSRCR